MAFYGGPPPPPPPPPYASPIDPSSLRDDQWVLQQPIPPIVAARLLEIDPDVAPWIVECLLFYLHPGFQLHQLRNWDPHLYFRRDDGHFFREYVVLSEVGPNPPPGRGYLRVTWRALEAYLHNTGPRLPAPLYGCGGRVRSALQEFFSNLPTTQQAADLAARGKVVFADGTSVVGPMFDKKLPEKYLFEAIKFFEDQEGYVIEPTLLGDRAALSRLAEVICSPGENAPLYIAASEELDLYRLRPLANDQGSLKESRGLHLNLDAASGGMELAGSAMYGPVKARSLPELLGQFRTILNSYLVACYLRSKIYPKENVRRGRAWLEPVAIDAYLNRVLASQAKSDYVLGLSTLSTILRREWHSMRDNIRMTGRTLSELLNDHGKKFMSVLYDSRTSVLAVCEAPQIAGMKRSLEEAGQAVAELRKVVMRGGDAPKAAGLPPPPAATEGPAVTRLDRLKDGNPLNSQLCIRDSCRAEDECRYSHAKKPWNENGANPRYPASTM